MTSGKIKKWEEEIERIQSGLKEYSQRCSDRIRELRRKIQEEEKTLTLENNRMIADIVRSIYGEVNAENVEAFKKQMMDLAPAPKETDPEKAG